MELLVSVALLLLVLTIFAEIFQTASAMMVAQKGMAENDQRARMLTTALRSDIGRRTFRDVIPYYSGQNFTLAGPGFVESRRRGYFSLSENDPNNPNDDVLALTIRTTLDVDFADQPAFTGRARVLPDPGLVPVPDADYLWASPNQPEYDDGQVDASVDPTTGLINNAGSSTTAEVTYFLRDSRLIRRVLLVRRPLTDPTTPTSATPSEFSIPAAPPGRIGHYDAAIVPTEPYFWRDFDYSAFFDPYTNVNAGFGRVWFHHWSDSLSNVAATRNTGALPAPPFAAGVNLPISLGIPHLRFGHSMITPSGAPREFLVGADGFPGVVGVDDDGNAAVDDVSELGFPGSDDVFIGRFTIQETADSNFLYPGTVTVGPDLQPGIAGVDDDGNLTTDDASELGYINSDDEPYGNLTLADAAPQDGIVDAFATDDARHGEDVLLTNVHAFDIKVLDTTWGVDGLPDPLGDTTPDDIPEFRDLGNGAADGYYSTTANAAYGNRYDTWHPYHVVGPPIVYDPLGVPPYRPQWTGAAAPDTDPLLPTFNNGNLGDPAAELPLKAIQVTIQFFDVSSNQMRQLTLILPLLDDDNGLVP